MLYKSPAKPWLQETRAPRLQSLSMYSFLYRRSCTGVSHVQLGHAHVGVTHLGEMTTWAGFEDKPLANDGTSWKAIVPTHLAAQNRETNKVFHRGKDCLCIHVSLLQQDVARCLLAWLTDTSRIE